MSINWLASAACKGYPTEWWFPEKGMPKQSYTNMLKAKKLCENCPVKQECYEDGVAFGAMGIWGGVALQYGRPSRRKKVK